MFSTKRLFPLYRGSSISLLLVGLRELEFFSSSRVANSFKVPRYINIEKKNLLCKKSLHEKCCFMTLGSGKKGLFT